MNDLEHLRQWVGRERIVTDTLSPFPAQALAAALDHKEVPMNGDALPPAWQWLYFLEAPSASMTAPDGHPRLGGFLPPVTLPRRMWASGSFDVRSPLTLGQTVQRRSVVKSVDAKSGKTGALVFVTLEHELSQQGRLCIREEQSLVYRAMPTEAVPATAPPGESAPSAPDWTHEVQPDPVLLFRYAALTYNSHRIHYDRSYAVEQEFYPALVVQGPLLATLLLDLLRFHLPAARVASFRFRALRPTFDTEPFRLNGKRDGNAMALWTSDADGQVAMSALATIA